jgi:beta-phosphoglucomutase-like phosphatase (HAD superfamily)
MGWSLESVKQMLKAILFDVDGTLAETEEFHRSAFNAAFVEQGLDVCWDFEEYRQLLRVTGGKERLTRYFRNIRTVMPQDRILAIHAAKNELYGRRLAQGAVELRPGVLRLIGEARAAGLKLGIATTTTAVNLNALLQPVLGTAHTDWSQAFDCVVAGDQVERKKPEPDVYLACLQRLGIGAEEAVAIEDSPAGVAAARAAGIAVLVAPSQYTLGENFCEADCVVPDLGDPQRPWLSKAPGFPRHWVDVAGLRNLVELTQGVRTTQRALPMRAG